MKTELKVKYLQFLLGKKKDQNEGFTLIELLVVVIIIGVLAAIALPNLLGQVGKARETEAKTALGSLNRGQQAYYLEKGSFYVNTTATPTDLNSNLGVAPGTKYYNYSNNSTTTFSKIDASSINSTDNGTRNYSAGVDYSNGAFITYICVGNNLSATPAIASGGNCTDGTVIK